MSEDPYAKKQKWAIFPCLAMGMEPTLMAMCSNAQVMEIDYDYDLHESISERVGGECILSVVDTGERRGPYAND